MNSFKLVSITFLSFLFLCITSCEIEDELPNESIAIEESNSNPKAAGAVPLYSYYRWGQHVYDNFLTTTRGSYGGYGYGVEVCKIFKTQVPGTVPVYSYYNRDIVDHFYTTNFNELGNGAGGWKREGVLGYVYNSPGSGRVPLYRFWSSTVKDHSYSKSSRPYTPFGYRYEGVLGYVPL